MYNKTQ